MSVTLLNGIQMVDRLLAILWPFKTGSVVRLWRKSNARPLTP